MGLLLLVISCLFYCNSKVKSRMEDRFKKKKKKRNWQMLVWSENVYKRGIRIFGQRTFAGERFLIDEHLTSSSAKLAWMINFKFFLHISSRLLHKRVATFFEQLIIHFFQYFNKFCIETNEGILFKKIFKLKKIAGTLLYKCWFATFHGKKSYWKREFWLCWSL